MARPKKNPIEFDNLTTAKRDLLQARASVQNGEKLLQTLQERIDNVRQDLEDLKTKEKELVVQLEQGDKDLSEAEAAYKAALAAFEAL